VVRRQFRSNRQSAEENGHQRPMTEHGQRV